MSCSPVRTILSVGLVCFVGILPACHKKSAEKGENETKEIELVVKKDSQLQLSQEELLKRRGALIRQRDKIKQQKAALEAEKKALAASDPSAAKALEVKEQELTKKERDLLSQEQDVTNRLNDLLKKRTDLLAKATAALSASASAGAPPVAKREHAVALREKDLARRELELSKREAALAKREASIAKRERELAKGCAAFASPSIVMPKITMPSIPSGRKYTKADVQSVLGRAARYLASKGLSVSDLPAPLLVHRNAAIKAMKKKRYAEAKQYADAFLITIRKIKLDRYFLQQKVRRLNALAQRKHLSKNQQDKVNKLLAQAMMAYNNGKFKTANRKLNQIAKLLK